MTILLNIAGLVLAVLMLWKGADFFVDAAARLARRMKISELAIGLTLVGLGTSAPEFAVSIGAALSGRSDISVANIVGSNIFNLGFILGGCAALVPITTSRPLVYRDGLFLIGVTVMLLAFIEDLTITRWEGITMMVLLVAYMGILFWQRVPMEEGDHTGQATWKDLPLGLGGLGLILGGAHILVECATVLAKIGGMSDWAIGVTIVAAGTSAPELVTAMSAVLKGRHGISAGTLIGSDLYNLLGVLGLASFIHPLTVSESGQGSVMLLVGMVVVVVYFMRTGWSVSRREGMFLVVVNLIRWWFDMSGSSVP